MNAAQIPQTMAQDQPYGDAPRQMADPVDAILGEELTKRRSIAATQAELHEEQAARFRSVERACVAGLEQLANKPTEAKVAY
jgi:hypothetical protein